MRLSHNLASLNIYRSYSKSVGEQSKALNNITLGLKVSSAKDNPNVVAQSEKIRMQIRGLQMAGRNMQDGISMLQTAEGGLNEMTSILQRIKEITLQAANGTTSPADKALVQKEVDQLANAYKDIAKNSQFNGVKLFDTPRTSDFLVGANSDEKVTIPFYDFTSDLDSVILGGADDIISGNTTGTLQAVNDALDKVISVRDKYGALSNRFQATYDNANEISEKMEKADSLLVDADVAVEMVNYSKARILCDAGNAMMAQSNRFPQEVLNSLANVGGR